MDLWPGACWANSFDNFKLQTVDDVIKLCNGIFKHLAGKSISDGFEVVHVVGSPLLYILSLRKTTIAHSQVSSKPDNQIFVLAQALSESFK